MKKIVDLQERIEGKKQKRKKELYQEKMETIQRVTQCSSCHFRCAMCGQYLNETDPACSADSSGFEYTFCDSCRGEFEDFMSVSRGEKHSGIFWHNREWEKMWLAWLDYQHAIAGFMDSPEFDLLLEELDLEL